MLLLYGYKWFSVFIYLNFPGRFVLVQEFKNILLSAIKPAIKFLIYLFLENIGHNLGCFLWENS